MLKRDYFLKALRAGAYQYKEWMVECFAMVALPNRPEVENLITAKELMIQDPYGKIVYDNEPDRYAFERYPYQLFKDDDRVVFFDRDTQAWEPLQEVRLNYPFFRFKDEITLNKGDLVNVDRELTTWYGNVVVNQTILCHSFGATIPFMAGQIKIGAIESKIAELLTSTPEQGEERDATKIYTDDLEKKYYQAAYSVTGWCQLAAPAATPYTILTDKNIIKRRNELLEQYKDQLHDATVVAKIMGELKDMDKAFQDQDPEKGFLKNGKDFDITRMKSYVMHGIERDFNDPNKITVIDRSLAEQWDIKRLPQMANSLIDGSYSRGFLTALGGEAAKFLSRFFLNTNIAEDDCGSTLGVEHIIDADNASGYLWAYALVNGKMVQVTPTNIEQFYGKPTVMRSPQFCNTVDGNFCVKCLGERYVDSRQSLSSLATETGNVFMSLMMSAMHGKAVKTEKWNWRRDLF
ncbi:RNA polymerase beta subunit [Pectobacterium phage vB_ParM-25]|nr:DNA-directed RNA polymerase subunit alpha [Serratia phage BUCT660]UQT03489.1 hypothetical protein KODAMA_00220 [Serratia phage vB_SmaM-Kodama]URG14194.1 RNA polymerase beta subunit [Pectobacterium phage vB_ParM-25]